MDNSFIKKFISSETALSCPYCGGKDCRLLNTQSTLVAYSGGDNNCHRSYYYCSFCRREFFYLVKRGDREACYLNEMLQLIRGRRICPLCISPGLSESSYGTVCKIGDEGSFDDLPKDYHSITITDYRRDPRITPTGSDLHCAWCKTPIERDPCLYVICQDCAPRETIETLKEKLRVACEQLKNTQDSGERAKIADEVAGLQNALMAPLLDTLEEDSVLGTAAWVSLLLKT